MLLRHWVITSRIGGGAFGETYTAVSAAHVGDDANGSHHHHQQHGHGEAAGGFSPNSTLSANHGVNAGEEVCIKVERNDKRMVLRLEVLALKKVQSCPYVVRYISSGRQDDINFLVMEKLGENLSELRRLTPTGAFELYTVLHIGVSCLQAIQGIHNLGLVHRDIKPSNFVVGNTAETRRRCYLIDFGLAKRFRGSNGEMKPARENAGFRGTSRYASLNSHRHKELGRVDDLWSLLFMLVEFITGTLPWRRTKEKEVIAELKAAHVGPQLVRNLPREFTPFVEHLMTLSFESEPDYNYLIGLLNRCRERRGYPLHRQLDWEIPNPTESPASPSAPPPPQVNAASGQHHKHGSSKKKKSKRSKESGGEDTPAQPADPTGAPLLKREGSGPDFVLDQTPAATPTGEKKAKRKKDKKEKKSKKERSGDEGRGKDNWPEAPQLTDDAPPTPKSPMLPPNMVAVAPHPPPPSASTLHSAPGAPQEIHQSTSGSKFHQHGHNEEDNNEVRRSQPQTSIVPLPFGNQQALPPGAPATATPPHDSIERLTNADIQGEQASPGPRATKRRSGTSPPSGANTPKLVQTPTKDDVHATGQPLLPARDHRRAAADGAASDTSEVVLNTPTAGMLDLTHETSVHEAMPSTTLQAASAQTPKSKVQLALLRDVTAKNLAQQQQNDGVPHSHPDLEQAGVLLRNSSSGQHVPNPIREHSNETDEMHTPADTTQAPASRKPKASQQVGENEMYSDPAAFSPREEADQREHDPNTPSNRSPSNASLARQQHGGGSGNVTPTPQGNPYNRVKHAEDGIATINTSGGAKNTSRPRDMDGAETNSDIGGENNRLESMEVEEQPKEEPGCGCNCSMM